MRRTITGDDARQAERETNDARQEVLKELDHLFDEAKLISCTRLSLAIEALIDAKIK